jgi:hypothetical protein
LLCGDSLRFSGLGDQILGSFRLVRWLLAI